MADQGFSIIMPGIFPHIGMVANTQLGMETLDKEDSCTLFKFCTSYQFDRAEFFQNCRQIERDTVSAWGNVLIYPYGVAGE